MINDKINILSINTKPVSATTVGRAIINTTTLYVTVSSGIDVNMYVYGVGIAPNTRVMNVDIHSNIITLSSNTTSAINGLVYFSDGGLTSFSQDLPWHVSSDFVGVDGYSDNKKIVITFSDSDNNGVVDDPELFTSIVAPSVNPLNKYVVFERYLITAGQEDYRYVDNSTGTVLIYRTKSDISVSDLTTRIKNGQYIYFVDTNTLTKYSSGKYIPNLDYKVYVGRDKLKFQYTHHADYESRIDPGASNIIDVYILSKSYDTAFRQWVNGSLTTKPLPPSSDELYNIVGSGLNLIKTISDEIIYHPVSYKVLFGSISQPELQATFKVTKTPGQVISDNDVKSQVILAINQFFSLENWDFGDTFYFTELSTYVMNKLATKISNFLIVPKQEGLNFGSLFEIKANSHQLFINGATVNDVEIINGITSSNIKSVNGKIITSNVLTQQSITSSSQGSL